MSSIFGPGNYSYFAIPAAWVVAMGAHFYAISVTKGWPNAAPRMHVAKLNLKEKPSALEKKILRAEAAQSNQFETIGLFGAAVVAGNLAKLGHPLLNQLSWGYIAARVVYTLLYINTETETVSNARSAAYLASMGCIFTLFIRAGLAVK